MSDEHTERDGWRCYDDPYYRRAERHQTVVSVEDDGWIEVAAEEGSGYQRESIRTFLPPSVVDWLVAERIMGIATGIIALGEWARRCGESWEEAEMLRHLSGDPYEGIYGDGRGGGR